MTNYQYLYTTVHKVTVALKYTLSRFEVVGDSTELSSIQLSSAQFNYASSVHRAQLSSTALSSIQLSSARAQFDYARQLSSQGPAQFNLEIQLRLQFEAMILGVF